MPEIDFEVFCYTCGAGLCDSTRVSYGNRRVKVTVEACTSCVELAREELLEKITNLEIELSSLREE